MMRRPSSARWILTAALLVAGIRMWMQVRGKTKTPLNEWVIGWGATFLFLAILAEWSEQAAAGLAGTIVVGDFLVNGSSLFNDATGLVTGATGGPVLVDQPFSGAPSSPSKTPGWAPAPTGRGASSGGPSHPSTGTP